MTCQNLQLALGSDGVRGRKESMLLVARPGAPSSVLVPSSNARSY